MMHERGKSDSPIVPRKPPNNAAEPAAEAVEGRGLAKGNAPERNAPRTQRRAGAPTALERVRQAARKDRKQRFTALLHHVYAIERLRAAYDALNRSGGRLASMARPGTHYGQALEANLQDLSGRLQRGAYRAQPVRRAFIPKADGRQRPLGVPALEDKIVQRAVVEVLNAIYDTDFLGFSYGFRPGRSPHHALDALSVGLLTKKVNWVLDADIRSFFDTLDHGMAGQVSRAPCGRPARRAAHPEMAERRRAGGRGADTVVRSGRSRAGASVRSWPMSTCTTCSTCGSSDGGRRRRTATLSSCVSRMTSSWASSTATRPSDSWPSCASGSPRFGLALHPDKTRLIEFGPFADRNRRGRGEGKPETFNFLGFTHSCGKTRKGGSRCCGRRCDSGCRRSCRR